jgi:hypothetical protein
VSKLDDAFEESVVAIGRLIAKVLEGACGDRLGFGLVLFEKRNQGNVTLVAKGIGREGLKTILEEAIERLVNGGPPRIVENVCPVCGEDEHDEGDVPQDGKHSSH